MQVLLKINFRYRNKLQSQNKEKIYQILFKLADRMRSIRTNGASKNRDSSRFFSVSKLFSIRSIFGAYAHNRIGIPNVTKNWEIGEI